MEVRTGHKNKFVLGFMFSTNLKDVLLIHKKRPEWQKDKLNGIGGKIDNFNELLHPELAMEREFKEETGIEFSKWKQFCAMNFGSNDGLYALIVFCFYTVVPKDFFYSAKSLTDEKLCIVKIDELGLCKIKPIDNLHWLIPLALNEDRLTNIYFS